MGFDLWPFSAEDGGAICAYCGHLVPKDDPEPHYRLVCPTCAREGCSECMPAGRGCECPECEGS